MNSTKRSLKKSINYFVVTGMVVNSVKIVQKEKGLQASVLMRVINSLDKVSYIEITALNDIAKELNLIGKIGNVLLVEGNFQSVTFLNIQRQKKVKMHLVADNIELIHASQIKGVKEIAQEVEVLRTLDPQIYLGESYARD